MCFVISALSVFILQTWYEKTPLGKKRAKAAKGGDDDDGGKGKKGKGKKGKKKK